jgi:hypothetical protein
MSGDLLCVGVFLLGLFFDLAASPTMDEFRKKRAKERNKPEKLFVLPEDEAHGVEVLLRVSFAILAVPKTLVVPRDVAVQNTSAIMADDEEAVEHGEGDRRNRKEIHRSDGFPMVT